MEVTLQAIFRTFISYTLLLTFTLFYGKQINSHKNHFNFALSITIGSFVANMGFDTNLHFIPMLYSFLSLMVMYYFFSLISLKSRRLRKWFTGEPTILIENGKILEPNMNKNRMSLDDLNQQLREQGIFDLNEVEYALLEVSGNVSVLPKDPFKKVKKKDLSAKTKFPPSYPIELIMEGKIIKKNLTSFYSLEWINEECEKRNIKVNDVFYAVIGTNNQIFFDLYKNSYVK